MWLVGEIDLKTSQTRFLVQSPTTDRYIRQKIQNIGIHLSSKLKPKLSCFGEGNFELFKQWSVQVFSISSKRCWILLSAEVDGI